MAGKIRKKGMGEKGGMTGMIRKRRMWKAKNKEGNRDAKDKEEEDKEGEGRREGGITNGMDKRRK